MTRGSSTATGTTRTLCIAGGGTGGHLFPGVAVAEAWLARDPAHKVLFVGTGRGIEARVVPQLGYPLALLDVSGLKGKGFTARVRALATLPGAVVTAARTLRREGVAVVLSVGGYAAGPAGLASAALGIPLAVLEQNSYAGLTNRVLGHVARVVFTAWDETAQQFPAGRVMLTGTPMRPSQRQAVERAQAARAEAHAGTQRPLLLITGGSQGAKALNEKVPEALSLLPASARTFDIVHQTGQTDVEATKARYAAAGFGEGSVTVTAFLDDLPVWMAKASLAVCRSGASTVAELCAVGTPAIYVPFPFAADDHQTFNARAVERSGGALVKPQADLTPADLAATISTLMADPAKLAAMGRAARALDRPQATAAVVDSLAELADNPQRKGALRASQALAV
jgi:UDP-N-acetylglucosamine--N-acetylmuramyl-(pentapeptide) pyrophosphoryl-undecaprenol N-acetylglucosamine transferase